MNSAFKCVVAAFGFLTATSAYAETYLCHVKPRYGEITIAPELAVQIFEDRGTARILDGVVNTVQENGAYGEVEKRPALTRVVWTLWLDRRINTRRQDSFTYRVAIKPNGDAIVTATVGTYNARTTGRCTMTAQSLDDIGTFGQRLDRPLRKF